MSMKNKYLICMLALLGMGLADLFYLNSTIIPAIWPENERGAQSRADQLADSTAGSRMPAKTVEEVFLPSADERKRPSEDYPADKIFSKSDMDRGPIERGVTQTDKRFEGKAVTGYAQSQKAGLAHLKDGFQQPSEKKIETHPLLLKEVIVPFESGEYRLNPKSGKELLARFEKISFDESIWVIIDGHSDVTGTGKFDNDRLSRQRAEFIADLLKQQGALESHLKIRGHGDTQPLDGRDVPEAFAKNRRAEIKIFKDEP